MHMSNAFESRRVLARKQAPGRGNEWEGLWRTVRVGPTKSSCSKTPLNDICLTLPTECFEFNAIVTVKLSKTYLLISTSLWSNDQQLQGVQKMLRQHLIGIERFGVLHIIGYTKCLCPILPPDALHAFLGECKIEHFNSTQCFASDRWHLVHVNGDLYSYWCAWNYSHEQVVWSLKMWAELPWRHSCRYLYRRPPRHLDRSSLRWLSLWCYLAKYAFRIWWMYLSINETYISIIGFVRKACVTSKASLRDDRYWLQMNKIVSFDIGDLSFLLTSFHITCLSSTGRFAK